VKNVGQTVHQIGFQTRVRISTASGSERGLMQSALATVHGTDKNSHFLLFVEITEAFNYAVRQIRS
jgi:hypothetical protein